MFVAVLALTACGPGGGGHDKLDSDNPLMADDLDLDSYHAEGTLDGFSWSGDLCALNLIPSFEFYYQGKQDPHYKLYFEAYDKEISGGVVTGGWQLPPFGEHPVSITDGTWSLASSPSAQEQATISVNLEVKESLPAPGGSINRTVTGAINLTPVVTSDECISMNDPDYLKEFLSTYGGPTGKV
jgi:hypothetical protein